MDGEVVMELKWIPTAYRMPEAAGDDLEGFSKKILMEVSYGEKGGTDWHEGYYDSENDKWIYVDGRAVGPYAEVIAWAEVPMYS